MVGIAVIGVGGLIHYNLNTYRNQNEPRIYTLMPTKELVLTIEGNPEYTFDTALLTFHSVGRLLKLSPSYFSGRFDDWESRSDRSDQSTTVDYVRPVPETLSSLGTIRDTDTVTLRLQRRDKTRIAELRHQGPYASIPESILRLKQFIASRDHDIHGFYEEVYLIFEAMEQDPLKFETLLRFEVRPTSKIAGE
jgi:hypothetical protein